ncbi:5151_t:CDS:1, partial [Ambispora leptoticha]
MSDAQVQRDESKYSRTAIASLRELNAKLLAEIAEPGHHVTL